MNKLLALISITIFISCNKQCDNLEKTPNQKNIIKTKVSKTETNDSQKVQIQFDSTINRTEIQSNNIEYGVLVEEYLKTKSIEPTIVFNNDGRSEINLLKHRISWRQNKDEIGIKIIIDGHIINTKDRVTLNNVWGTGIDSINFANSIQQVKIYEEDSLIGFVLTYEPCSGLGCGVNYQLIYCFKTKQLSCFGRFRTGFEFELYNFNSDNLPDYLSKTFYGRNNAQMIDTTLFVMYSQTKYGNFKEFKTNNQKGYWFKRIYSEFGVESINEKFEENWIGKININSR